MGPWNRKIQPKTQLTDKAYQAIKDGIIHYQLKPGSPLRLADLSQALQMSQTPIREAMIRLEQEHFVQRYGAKGYMVKTMDVSDVEDLYDLRLILEVSATRQAASRMSEDDLQRLSQTHQQVKSLASVGRKGEALHVEQEFHTVIMEAGSNRLLSEMGRLILDRVVMIQNLNLLTSDRLGVAHAQHEEILKAIGQRDADAAAALMANHLTSAKEFVISRLKNDEDILSKLLVGPPLTSAATGP